MDLKTLRTFQAIVRRGSFNRAAQEMNYVQSTVTMQMQKLEAELGVQLLERGKEVRLTEAGRLFHEESVQIVRRMEQLQSRLTDMQAGEAGHIRLGATEPTASYRLPALLKAFMDRYPHVRVSVDIANTPALGERIRRGEIDFALATAPTLGAELVFEPLFRETFAALLPERHPLAKRAAIAPEDLTGHRLLITSATCPYRRKLELVLQERGIASPDTMEVGSMTALRFYAESGLGIALVPRIAAGAERDGTVVRPVDGSLIHMTCGVLYQESAYPFPAARQRLYTYLTERLAELPEPETALI